MAKQVDEKLAQALQDEGYFIMDKKTIKWGLGILGFVLLSLWGFLQTSINSNSEKADKVQKTLTELVEKMEDKKVDPTIEKLNEVQGDVKVILDRTNSRYMSNNNSNYNPNANNTTAPTNIGVPNNVNVIPNNGTNLPTNLPTQPNNQ